MGVHFSFLISKEQGIYNTTLNKQNRRLDCSPAGAGGGWELRLRLQRLDPRERTEVGWVNTA